MLIGTGWKDFFVCFVHEVEPMHCFYDAESISADPQRGSVGVERFVGRPEATDGETTSGSQLAPLVAPDSDGSEKGGECNAFRGAPCCLTCDHKRCPKEGK